MNSLKIQIDEITNTIIHSSPSDNDISLYSGNSGRILYLANVYFQTGEKNIGEKIEELIVANLKILEEKSVDFGMFNGLAGFGWLILLLVESNFLSKSDVESIIDFIDSNICSEIEYLRIIDNKEAHLQILELSKYLFKRENSPFKRGNDSIEKTLDQIYDLNFVSMEQKCEKLLPEIIIFKSNYSKVKKKDIEFKDWITQNFTHTSDNSYCFDLQENKNLRNALALFFAGRATGINSLKRRSLVLLKYNCYNKSRIDFFNSTNISGDIWVQAYIYGHFYLKTKYLLFSKTYDYWLETRILPSLYRKKLPLGLSNGLSGFGLIILEKLYGAQLNWNDLILE